MEIIVTKNAGFCFGVKNAIDKSIALAKENKSVYTYGPIIHNKKVVEDLLLLGIKTINNIEDIKQGDTIIIRSHGISKAEFTKIGNLGASIIDATCINVKKIHKIVEENYKSSYKIVIIGDPSHPEVKGINGWCDNTALVVNDIEDLEIINGLTGKLCIVAQTTFNKEKWELIVDRISEVFKESLVFNTICSATELRQGETMALSKKVDTMIIIGGKESSNTHKLYEISKLNCKNTLFIEDALELDIDKIRDAKKIGITGGASTPDNVIKGVVDKMNELTNVNEESVIEEKVIEENVEIEKANNIEDYFADYKDVHPGSIVEGKVIQVNNKEVFIDISYKSDGLLSMDEASYTPINLKESYKVGDIVKVKVLVMNDGEGNVVLSRKALEKDDFFKKIYQYKEEGTVVEVLINGVNKGGLNTQYGDIRGFMPLSLSGIGRDEDVESYKGKRLSVKIVDIKERRGNIELLVSRKEMVAEENKLKKIEFFEKLECDKIYSGVVKAIINTGIFVKVVDIDVFVPISELAWKRINKPQDVVSEGQKVELLMIKVDKEHLRATGSIKKVGKEPFQEFISKNNVDDIIKGRVARFADFGVFVELIDGVDGLVHISNLSQERVNKPQDVVKQDEIIDVKIIKIDVETRKISLSLKDAKAATNVIDVVDVIDETDVADLVEVEDTKDIKGEN